MAPKKRSRHVLEGHDRGGHRMRAAAEEADAAEVGHSPLFHFLAGSTKSFTGTKNILFLYHSVHLTEYKYFCELN